MALEKTSWRLQMESSLFYTYSNTRFSDFISGKIFLKDYQILKECVNPKRVQILIHYFI